MSAAEPIRFSAIAVLTRSELPAKAAIGATVPATLAMSEPVTPVPNRPVLTPDVSKLTPPVFLVKSLL